MPDGPGLTPYGPPPTQVEDNDFIVASQEAAALLTAASMNDEEAEAEIILSSESQLHLLIAMYRLTIGLIDSIPHHIAGAIWEWHQRPGNPDADDALAILDWAQEKWPTSALLRNLCASIATANALVESGLDPTLGPEGLESLEDEDDEPEDSP